MKNLCMKKYCWQQRTELKKKGANLSQFEGTCSLATLDCPAEIKLASSHCLYGTLAKILQDRDSCYTELNKLKTLFRQSNFSYIINTS